MNCLELLSHVAELETKSGLSKQNVPGDHGGADNANGDGKCETSRMLYSSIVRREVSPSSLQTCNNASARNDGSQPTRNDERKYVLVFGLEECKKGTPRLVRQQEDMAKAVGVFGGVDESIFSITIGLESTPRSPKNQGPFWSSLCGRMMSFESSLTQGN